MENVEPDQNYDGLSNVNVYNQVVVPSLETLNNKRIYSEGLVTVENLMTNSSTNQGITKESTLNFDLYVPEVRFNTITNNNVDYTLSQLTQDQSDYFSKNSIIKCNIKNILQLNKKYIKWYVKEMSIDTGEDIWDWPGASSTTEISSGDWKSVTPPTITNGRKTVYIGHFNNNNNKSFIQVNVLGNPDGGSDTVPVPANSTLWWKQWNSTWWSFSMWIVYDDGENSPITLYTLNLKNAVSSYNNDITIQKIPLLNTYIN